MKTILNIALALLLGYTVHSQDTTYKKIEYDLTIEAATNTKIPWLKAYINKHGADKWMKVLLDDLKSGEILCYDALYNAIVPPELYFDETNPVADTVYVVDPITFEEKIEIFYKPTLRFENITAIRIFEKWEWDNETNTFEKSQYGFFPLFKFYDYTGALVDKAALLWIKLE